MDFFSTEYLNGVVRNVKRVPSFFLNAFFPSAVYSDKEEIVIERKNDKAVITPFVHPMSEGKIIPGQGSTVDTLKPAYLKDTRAFNPTKAIKRMAGESLGGDMSLEQRHQAIVAQDMSEMVQYFDRRKEVMAAEAIINGTLVVKGEGFDVTVDFKRPSDHTVALTGNDKWDVVDSTGFGTAQVDDQLEDFGAKISAAGGGKVRAVIMDIKAWKLFRKNKWIRGKENGTLNLDRGSNTNLVVDPSILEDGVAEYKGNYGSFQIWVYSAEYIDPADGSTKNVMPDNTIVLVGDQVEGVRYFGAIMHVKSMVAVESFVNSWTSENPSREMYQLQSAPLMVPHRPYATMKITVA